MNRFPFFRFLDARACGCRLLCVTAIVAIALASFVVDARQVAAQTEYDFNGDGKVTCDDFKEEFPDSYTNEATKALEHYPEELKRLDGKDGTEGVACEGQPADKAADKASEEANSMPEPEPEAAVPTADAPESTDVPADVMARVEGCAVVAISARDVVGAGCPGVGVVTFRIPDDAPAMQDTVLMSPGAADEATVESSGSNGDDTEAANTGQNTANGKNGNTGQDQETTKAGKNKADDGTKDEKDKKGKKDKGKDKKGKGKKDKKGGKNSAKKQDKNEGQGKSKNKKNGKRKGKK